MSMIANALKKIYEEEGIDIYQDPYRFYSLAEDYFAGRESRYLEYLSFGISIHILTMIERAHKEPSSQSRQKILSDAEELFLHNSRQKFTEDDAADFLQEFCGAHGWNNIKFSRDKKKAPPIPPIPTPVPAGKTTSTTSSLSSGEKTRAGQTGSTQTLGGSGTTSTSKTQAGGVSGTAAGKTLTGGNSGTTTGGSSGTTGSISTGGNSGSTAGTTSTGGSSGTTGTSSTSSTSGKKKSGWFKKFLVAGAVSFVVGGLGKTYLGDRSVSDAINDLRTSRESSQTSGTSNTEILDNSMADSGFILPTSNTAYLSEADLSSLSVDELCLARNEIFARYGRKFKTEWVQSYFDERDWYVATYEADDFDQNMKLDLNDCERANIVLIQNLERDLNPTAPHDLAIRIENVSWEQAARNAKEEGGYLLQINSEEEFNFITNALNSYGHTNIHFYLGGRRDSDGRNYYWLNRKDQLAGECLNASGSWAYTHWYTNEPSLYDQVGDRRIEENVMNLFNVNGTWCLNDSSDDLIGNYPDYLMDKVGYIIEYQNDAD